MNFNAFPKSDSLLHDIFPTLSLKILRFEKSGKIKVTRIISVANISWRENYQGNFSLFSFGTFYNCRGEERAREHSLPTPYPTPGVCVYISTLVFTLLTLSKIFLLDNWKVCSTALTSLWSPVLFNL